MAKSTEPHKERRAKLFPNGRSQAVRLPKEFRFEGKEVKVRRALGGVLLEPVEPERKPGLSVQAWFAQMDALRGDPIFPDGREQPAMQERDWQSFDKPQMKFIFDSNLCIAILNGSARLASRSGWSRVKQQGRVFGPEHRGA